MLLSRGASKPRSRIFISKAIIVLCAARNCRDADHLQNFVYDRRMIAPADLLRSIAEARSLKIDVLDHVIIGTGRHCSLRDLGFFGST